MWAPNEQLCGVDRHVTLFRWSPVDFAVEFSSSPVPRCYLPRMAKPTNSSELKPNPYADLPLPAYAQAWGNSVYRPENLPVNHDIRLDPAHIFAFPQHPETNEAEEYFVVGIRCSQCSRARQLCSRGDPICRRCTEKNLVCRPMGPGWEECPDTRVKKPRLLQEMVALQKSLPDAPYYREHSSAVSKTISSGTNSSLKLRKGRQTWQESATPVRRGRKSEGAVRREEEDTSKTLVESEQAEDKGKDGLEAESLGGVKSDVAKDGEKDTAIVSSARTDGKLSAIGSNSVTTIVNGLPSSQATAIEDAQPLSPSSTLVVTNGGTAYTSGEQSGQGALRTRSNLLAASYVVLAAYSASIFVEQPSGDGHGLHNTDSPRNHSYSFIGEPG